MDKVLKSKNFPLPQSITYLFLVIFLGIAFGLVAQKFLSFVVDSGHLILKDGMGRDYLIGVITSVILGFSILFWPISKIHKQDLILIWFLRTVLTLGLLIFFESSHSQDSYYYFNDALNGTCYTCSGGIERAGPAYRLVTFLTGLNHVIPDSYHGLKVFFSMIGMLACYLFYKCTVLLLGSENRKIFYFFTLFPSLFFWSSVIDKGTIIIFAMAVYAYGTISWHKTKKIIFFAPILSGIFIVFHFRVWMAGIAAFPLVILFLTSDIKLYKKIALALASLIITFFLGKQFILSIQIENTLDSLLHWLNILSTKDLYTVSGSGRTVNLQLNTWSDIFSFLPLGIFTALFRPLPWELPSLLGILAGFENIFLLVLLFIAFLKTRWENIKKSIFMWLFFLILTWASCFSLISYQNFGTAIRYKAQILPFILLLIVYLVNAKPTATSILNNS
jgi:hypothetical protein